MLPHKQRVSTILFKEIIKKGKVLNVPLFTIYSLKGDKISRFAIAFSKNTIKTAVLRNKLKRRVYSIIHGLSTDIINKQNIILILKKGVKDLDFKELKKEIVDTFVKSKILK